MKTTWGAIVVGVWVAVSACQQPGPCGREGHCAPIDAGVGAGALDAGEGAGARDGGVRDAGPLPFDPDAGMPLAAGDTCAQPVPLPLGVVVTSSTTGLTNDYDFGPGAGCAGLGSGATAPDAVFSVTVPAQEHLVVEVGGAFLGSLDLVLSPAACGTLDDGGVTHDAQCVAGGTFSTVDGRPEAVAWKNASGAPVQVLLVIDGVGSADEGDFALRAHTLGTLPGDTCDTATPLPLGAQLVDESLSALDGYLNDYQGTGDGTCPTFSTGVDRVYQVVLPPGATETFTATPHGAWPVKLSVVESPAECLRRVCLDEASVQAAGFPQEVTLTNPGTTPLTRYVIVDTAYAVVSTYDVSLTTARPGETCAVPVPLTAGVPLTDQSLDGFANDLHLQDNANFADTCVTQAGLSDRVYSFAVPQGQRATLTFTPVDPRDGFTVDLVEGADATCAPGSDCVTSLWQGTTLEWTNRGSGPTVVKAVVNASNPLGRFSLALAYSTPPAGDFCAAATPLTPGSLHTTLAGFEPDVARHTDSCLGGFPAPAVDRVYSVTVPGGQRLIATALPAGPWLPVLNVSDTLAGCEGSVCVARSEAVSHGTATTVTWLNPSPTQAQTVFLTVAAVDPGSPLDFGLDVTLDTPRTGDVCTHAPAVQGGALTAAGLKTFGYVSDYGGPLGLLPLGSGCFGSSGPDLAWAVEVPVGQTLTATVTPDAASAPAVNLVTDCAEPSACLAGAGWDTPGKPVTVTWTNTRTAAVPLNLIVGSSFGGMTFDLEVTVR
jgi:hypothetical protein